MTLGRGVVPVSEQGLLPPELAVAPGVMVIVQMAPGSKGALQLAVLEMVSVGHDGIETLKLMAGMLPVLVMVSIRCVPELGVPTTPYSVSPVTLKAKSLTLVDKVVLLVTQFTCTSVTLEAPTVPLPFVTVHTWFTGRELTVTE